MKRRITIIVLLLIVVIPITLFSTSKEEIEELQKQDRLKKYEAFKLLTPITKLDTGSYNKGGFLLSKGEDYLVALSPASEALDYYMVQSKKLAMISNAFLIPAYLFGFVSLGGFGAILASEMFRITESLSLDTYTYNTIIASLFGASFGCLGVTLFIALPFLFYTIHKSKKILEEAVEIYNKVANGQVINTTNPITRKKEKIAIKFNINLTLI